MRCKQCEKDKLSKEFPPETVNKDCKHASLVCLQCILTVSDDTCPEATCDLSISPDRKAWFKAIWKEHFTMFAEPVKVILYEGKVSILLLNGDSSTIDVEQNMSVLRLMTEIKRTMGIEINEQKLLYKGKEMQRYRENKSFATLDDYGITSGCSIQLVKLLYALPQSFDKVVFDLSWQYPSDVGIGLDEKRDYLDASCLLFEGENCKTVIDYVQQDPRMKAMMSRYKIKQKNWGVIHDGDRMDDRRRIGHHIIRVSVKEIPPEITHLFFTLSAWNSPTISRYPNPTLNFYDSNNPDVSLCDTTFTHAGHSQAVIMCCLSHSTSGGWTVYQNGQTSKGNAKDYGPLKATISELIREGY